MRTLLLFRGAPGCGKSTYIKEHNLEQYVLSADTLRLMCQSAQETPAGQMEISPQNDDVVWEMLFKLLEVRMYWVERFRTKIEMFRRKKLNKWSDKRTDRILKYVFPKACKVNTLNNSFYFTCRDNAYLLHWSLWSRPWDWYYCNLHNVKILNYLAWDFEMPRYVKTTEEEEGYPDNWITVIFKKEL